MNIWTAAAKETLYDLNLLEAAIEALPEEIALIKSKMTSIKSASSGSAPVQGGGTAYEDKMNSAIVKKYMLENQLTETEKEVELTKKALSTLSEQDLQYLQIMYISRQKNGLKRLCEEMGVDEKTARKYANIALDKYTKARYGKS